MSSFSLSPHASGTGMRWFSAMREDVGWSGLSCLIAYYERRDMFYRIVQAWRHSGFVYNSRDSLHFRSTPRDASSTLPRCYAQLCFQQCRLKYISQQACSRCLGYRCG